MIFNSEYPSSLSKFQEMVKYKSIISKNYIFFLLKYLKNNNVYVNLLHVDLFIVLVIL